MKVRGLFKRGDWYYYWPPQVEGIRPKRVALHTKDQGKAISLALELQRRQVRHVSGGRLSGEIERFMASKTASGAYRPKTAVVTRNALKLFCDWAGDPRACDVTPKVIDAWREEMLSEGRATSGVVTYLRRVQSLFSWLVKQDRLVSNPFDKVDTPVVKRSRDIRFCTRDQRDALIAACDREDLMFILMTGFFLGLRRIEMIEARPEWFRTPGLVVVSASDTYLPKDKEKRVIHYGKRFGEFLESYGIREPFMLRPEVSHTKSLYRWDGRRPYDEFIQSQGMRWATMHVLRHTFATLHIQAGTPLTTVADWLGDSYQVTYQHYAAYAPTDAHVRNLD